MTCKLRCSIFHETDGECCKSGEACPLVAAAERQDLPMIHFPPRELFWLVLTVFGILTFALFQMNSHDAKMARLNQEQIAWRMK